MAGEDRNAIFDNDPLKNAVFAVGKNAVFAASSPEGEFFQTVLDEPRPENYVDHRNYKEKRASEYPDIGDQLDAIWKQINQDRLNGKDLVQEADDLLGSILATKAKYPKPE
jgi:hypothetical protein